MPETKSGTESIQKMPGTCSCTRKKGSHQKLWISSKGQRSQFEGIQKGQAVLKKKKKTPNDRNSWENQWVYNNI